MRYFTILFLLLPACSVSPGWATDTELAQNAADDQKFAAEEDAKLVTVLRSEGIAVAAYNPGVPVAPPPPVTVEEGGWSDTLTKLLTVAAAVAAALGGVRFLPPALGGRGPATPQTNKETVAEAAVLGKKA